MWWVSNLLNRNQFLLMLAKIKTDVTDLLLVKMTRWKTSSSLHLSYLRHDEAVLECQIVDLQNLTFKSYVHAQNSLDCCDFNLKNLLTEILFLGPKFHFYTTSGYEAIKKFGTRLGMKERGGGVRVYTTIYAPRVKVKVQRSEQIHRFCTLSSGDQQNND